MPPRTVWMTEVIVSQVPPRSAGSAILAPPPRRRKLPYAQGEGRIQHSSSMVLATSREFLVDVDNRLDSLGIGLCHERVVELDVCHPCRVALLTASAAVRGLQR
jgi:hypothetical protein